MTAYTAPAPATPKPTDNRTEEQYLIDSSIDYLNWKGHQYKRVKAIGFVDKQTPRGFVLERHDGTVYAIECSEADMDVFGYIIKLEQQLGVRVKIDWEKDEGRSATVTRAQTKGFDMD